MKDVDKNKEILDFIKRFKESSKSPEVLVDIFSNGYCYHFAVMLRSTFPGGTICLCYPYGHCVYLYHNEIYDINGVSQTSSNHFISMDSIHIFSEEMKQITDEFITKSPHIDYDKSVAMKEKIAKNNPYYYYDENRTLFYFHRGASYKVINRNGFHQYVENE